MIELGEILGSESGSWQERVDQNFKGADSQKCPTAQMEIEKSGCRCVGTLNVLPSQIYAHLHWNTDGSSRIVEEIRHRQV